jgi:hypothetical protein
MLGLALRIPLLFLICVSTDNLDRLLWVNSGSLPELRHQAATGKKLPVMTL